MEALQPGIPGAGSLAALGSARPGQNYLSPIASVLAERRPASAPARRAYSRPPPPHREARRGPGARDPHGAGGRRPGRAQRQPREQRHEPSWKRERKPRPRGRGERRQRRRAPGLQGPRRHRPPGPLAAWAPRPACRPRPAPPASPATRGPGRPETLNCVCRTRIEGERVFSLVEFNSTEKCRTRRS